jgi:hypothetical protein
MLEPDFPSSIILVPSIWREAGPGRAGRAEVGPGRVDCRGWGVVGVNSLESGIVVLVLVGRAKVNSILYRSCSLDGFLHA